MAIDDYSTTPASNTSINGINIAEGCPPSVINNAIRQLMADCRTGLYPLGWISGLTYARAADTDHDTTIAVGTARDSTDAQNIVLASAITKQIDAAWAVGTNAGGMDTGSVGNTTWYFIWLIKRSDTGVVDALYSTSSTAPTMPTNYNYKRLIGMVRTDGSANIVNYSTMELTGGGLDYLWATPVVDVNTTEDATANTRVLTGVPTGVKTIANVFHAYTNTNANDTSTRISSPDADDVAPSATTATTHYVADGASAHGTGQFIRVRTDTSAQVRTRIAAAAGTVNIVVTVLGFEWSRR